MTKLKRRGYRSSVLWVKSTEWSTIFLGILDGLRYWYDCFDKADIAECHGCVSECIWLVTISSRLSKGFSKINALIFFLIVWLVAPAEVVDTGAVGLLFIVVVVARTVGEAVVVAVGEAAVVVA